MYVSFLAFCRAYLLITIFFLYSNFLSANMYARSLFGKAVLPAVFVYDGLLRALMSW
jgi:hypothetical protein